MTNYTRLSTARGAIEITHGAETACVAQGSAQNTAAKALAELRRQARELPDLFVHRNRDGSWALATGHETPVWSEDGPISPVRERPGRGGVRRG